MNQEKGGMACRHEIMALGYIHSAIMGIAGAVCLATAQPRISILPTSLDRIISQVKNTVPTIKKFLIFFLQSTHDLKKFKIMSCV